MRSYLTGDVVHKTTGKRTPIQYEDGQFVFHAWVPADPKAASKTAEIVTQNRYAALAVE